MILVTGMADERDASESVDRRPDGDLLRTVAPVFVVYGIVARIWMLVTPIGSLDSDEAIAGLMSRHILDGELPMFYWGQTHGGPHEALLTAGFFRVFGSSTLVLKLVAVLLVAVACMLIWRVGVRTVGEQPALVAALLFWVWPAAFFWWSVKSRGFYHAGLVIGLAVLLFALRVDERGSPLDMAALGALVATPIVYVKSDEFDGNLGDIAATHPLYGRYKKALEDTMSDGYARLIGP